MISKSCAEFLNLPEETPPELARAACLRLRDQLRQSIGESQSAGSQFESQARLEQVEGFLAKLTPPPKPSGEVLDESIRAALDLDEKADVEEALKKAEARLKEIIATQAALKPKHPAHPKLKRDRERFAEMVATLISMCETRQVDQVCEKAERAIESVPPKKAKAREHVRRVRIKAPRLPEPTPEAPRPDELTERVEKTEVVPAMSRSPVEAAPQSPFQQLEHLIDKGMACLTPETPAQSEAHDFFAEAEKEAAGKNIPANIKSRMRLFKRTLDQVRRESFHAQVGGLLQQCAAAMAKEPADILSARQSLGLATALLREAPDPYYQAEVNRRERAIQEHERWLARRRIDQEEAPAETRLQAHRPKPALQAGYALPTIVLPAETEEPIATLNTVPPPASEPEVPELPPTPTSSAPTQPQPAPQPNQRKEPNRALQVAVALLLVGVFGAAFASFLIFKIASTHNGNLVANKQNASPPSASENTEQSSPPSSVSSAPDIGEISLTVQPPEAELFTNGVSMGHPDYPLRLRGSTGQELTLTATLEGYSNAMKSVTFSTPQSLREETLELQPKPALLIVHSEPSSADITLREGNSATITVTRRDEGIEVSPGVPLEISVDVPDHDIARTNLPAFKVGEQRLVDFGRLRLQTATLRVKAQPGDARFTVVYSDHPPVPFGFARTLEGILPRVPFTVIAEKPGYASASNSFLLKPRQVAEYDFGKLKPLSASVAVTATPAKFNLKVAWDGASKDYGPQGRAGGLPPGKNLLLTVWAAGYQSATTNVVLDPGEQRELFFGGLQPAQSFLLIKSDPPAAEVTCSIDGHFPVVLGATNRIDNLPLGHLIEVTLHKPGYLDRPMTRQFLVGGDTLDFGHLTTIKSAEAEKKVEADKAAAEQTRAAQIEKLLRQIQSYVITVRNNVPLTETSRRDWNQWITQVEAMQRNDPQLLNSIQPSLTELREVVNRTTSFSTTPFARNGE